MRLLSRLPCRQKQAFAADLDRHQRKSIELAKVMRSQSLVCRTDAEASIPEQQQEMVAVASREEQVMQYHDYRRPASAGFHRQPLQHRHLVRQVEMLQRLVEQINSKPLRKQ